MSGGPDIGMIGEVYRPKNVTDEFYTVIEAQPQRAEDPPLSGYRRVILAPGVWEDPKAFPRTGEVLSIKLADLRAGYIHVADPPTPEAQPPTPSPEAPEQEKDDSVERAAIAMCESANIEWSIQTEMVKDYYRKLARVALEGADAARKARFGLGGGVEVIDSGQTVGLHIGLPVDSARKLLAFYEAVVECDPNLAAFDVDVDVEVAELRDFLATADAQTEQDGENQPEPTRYEEDDPLSPRYDE